MRFDIRLRMLLLILLTALPLSGIGLWSARELGLAMEERLHQGGEYVINQIIQEYIDPINTVSGILQTIGISVETDDPDECTHQLKEAVRITPQLSGVLFIRASDGKAVCSSSDSSTNLVIDDRDVKEAIENRMIRISGYHRGKVSRREIIRIIVPVIEADGAVNMLVIGGVDLKVLNERVGKGLHLTNQVVVVFDHYGNIVGYVPGEKQMVGVNIADSAVYKQALHGQDTQGTVSDSVFFPGNAWAITREVPEIVAEGLYVALLVSTDVFYAPLKDVRNTTIMTTLLLLVLTVGLTMVLVNRSILRPIAHLAWVTNRFAKGDLNARAGQAYDKTELGGLMQDFDAMADVVAHNIHERERLARMKAQFMSSVSHELRTPLTSIKGSLALVNAGVMGDLPPDVREMTGVAEDSCERLIRLINDLLDMDKLAAGKMTINWADVPLSAVLDDLRQEIEGYAAQYGVRVVLQAAEAEGVLLRTDRDRLLQVLLNLVSNAVKFSPQDQPVTVSVSRPAADSIQIAVRDHGPGIPADFRDRIFKSFNQADSSDRRAKGGTGLGLAISKSIMELLGGDIGFDSVQGQGSTFFVIMPLPVPPKPEDSDGETAEGEL